MSVTESMNRDNRYMDSFAIPGQLVIDRGVIDVGLGDKDGFIWNQVLNQLGKLDHSLPV